MSSRLCVSSVTENPLKLSPLYREYWGEQMASFTKRTDVFAKAGCYVPRFYHAPDSERQLLGVPANGHLTYLLSLPIGSFLLGFLHTTSSLTGSDVVGSGFTCQITDQSINHKLFSLPADELWFMNDIGAGLGNVPPYNGTLASFTFPSFPRLLPVPYPVVPPGQFQVEFWNSLDSLNTDCQMTFLVMVPDGVNTNAGKGSSK